MRSLPRLSGRAPFEIAEIDGASLIHLCKPDPILQVESLALSPEATLRIEMMASDCQDCKA